MYTMKRKPLGKAVKKASPVGSLANVKPARGMARTPTGVSGMAKAKARLGRAMKKL